jgi:hypothetical protein
MLEDLAKGLEATGRAKTWNLDPRSFELWDEKCTNWNIKE